MKHRKQHFRIFWQRYFLRLWSQPAYYHVWWWPFSAAFALVLLVRGSLYQLGWKKTTRLSVPVIVVGNILVGGTGKTPALLYIAQALTNKGWKVGIISRGYGANIGTEGRLVEEYPSAELVGDEPLLLFQKTQCPVAVHPKRALAANALLRKHPTINILLADDGLQHLSLARDIEIIIEDARGIGNGWVLPTGPLREFSSRRQKVDAIIRHLSHPPSTVPSTQHHAPLNITMHSFVQSAYHLQSKVSKRLTEFSHYSLAACAGIGQPERFFEALRATGITLAHTLALPDHADAAFLRFDEIPQDIIFITEKDAVKCQNCDDSRIWVVPLETELSDPLFISWLIDTIHERQKNF